MDNYEDLFKKDTEKPLEKFGRDITKEVKSSKHDPIIGREEEIRAAIEILSRKKKNNPVLIGEAGVGKTAIVEGLAERITKNDVPDNLKNKIIWELDLASLVAGAKFKGQFEERLKSVLKEIKDSNGNIIMFIDELHMITGGSGGDSMNLSNMLKPNLADGTIHVIGATTLKEYHEYIEKDSALERRFQPVMVKEPTVEDTITILRGLKESYEIYHGVTIKDKALISAATLSERYITNRFLPDKAIDLVDEACAEIKMQMQSVPLPLDDIRRKIMTLEIEEQALKKENDKFSSERKEEIKKEINVLREKEKSLKESWEEEKKENEEIATKKKELALAKKNLEIAEDSYNLEDAARLKHGIIPELEKELNELKSNNKSLLLSDTVSEENIAHIISKWTGIPINKLTSSETEKLKNLKNNMEKRIIGQEEALNKVTNSIIRSRAGIKDPSRPIGSFLFLGSTGVGKTEVAKTLAFELFDDEKHLIRLDMSEYMEPHSVAKMIGSPPGYIGYDEGGQLTEKVRRNPYSIILFDEIEKAHPDVYNILLQILDDGRITDSQGRTINFKNTIIIMTSNIGSSYILDNTDHKDDLIQRELRHTFKPEFLNRIDEIIIFNSLSKNSMYQILDKITNNLENRLQDKHLTIELTLKAKDYIINKSYNPSFGARPLKRYFEETVENLIAKSIIENKLQPNSKIIIDVENNELIIKNI